MMAMYQKKVIAAFRKTLKSYERLIDNPEREWIKWKEFGYRTTCRACIACNNQCSDCPMALLNPLAGMGCLSASYTALYNLCYANSGFGRSQIRKKDLELLTAAAIWRYLDLLELEEEIQIAKMNKKER